MGIRRIGGCSAARGGCSALVCAALGTASALCVSDALGGPCNPLRIAGDGGALPEVWRKALDALVESTVEEGRPWSCVGGVVSLELAADDNAVLRIVDERGRAIERHLSSPDDVVPSGEAVLAVPVPEAPRPLGGARAGADLAIEPPPERTKQRSATVRSRLVIDALTDLAYATPTRSAWSGGTLRGTINLDAWAAGIWARVDLPVYVLDPVPTDFSMSDVGIGLSLARRVLLLSPCQVYLGFQPSVAVVSMEGGPELHGEGRDPDHPEGAKVDMRVGAEVRAQLPLSGVWHGLLSLDGEFAPAGLGPETRRRIHEALPLVPAYIVGLSVGVGAAVW